MEIIIDFNLYIFELRTTHTLPHPTPTCTHFPAQIAINTYAKVVHTHTHTDWRTSYCIIHWSLIDVGAFVRTFQLSLNFSSPPPPPPSSSSSSPSSCCARCNFPYMKKKINGKQGKSCWKYMAGHLQINWMLNFNNFAYFALAAQQHAADKVASNPFGLVD